MRSGRVGNRVMSGACLNAWVYASLYRDALCRIGGTVNVGRDMAVVLSINVAL
jgi:hypothetical protein